MKSFHILVTGANGQLGTELRRQAAVTPYRWHFTDLPELDIADGVQVQRLFERERYGCCINCAAYTAVDRAESEPDIAYRINAEGPAVLAAISAHFQASLLHISTDFVFGGRGNLPISEGVPADPVSVYGKSKAAGESNALSGNDRVIVLRTSWLYSTFGNNFFKTILRLGAERDELRVVYDQVGSPTYARDLAGAILALVDRLAEGNRMPEKAFGIYHFSNEGVASWYDFAVEIASLAGLRAEVVPIRTADYPLPAPRPAYSVLDKQRIREFLGMRISNWREALHRCYKEYTSPPGSQSGHKQPGQGEG